MPTIRRHPDRSGVQLLDPIEGVRYDLYVPESDVGLEQRSDDAVPVPADAVARIWTGKVRLPKRFELVVHDDDLGVVATVDPDDPSVPTLPDAGSYLIEVTSVPLKLYLQVSTRFDVERTDSTLAITFPQTESVDIAIRSFHEQPAGTITVGDSVRDEMEAISRFGSALKTMTPERAWPTLRGHPPLVERGPELHIPEGIGRPSTGITLHIPPDREHIYPAAPLAYYVGARLEPTSGQPRLTAANTEVRIDGDEYTGALNDLLRRLFVLDVAARNEGMYPFRVEAHDRIADAVDGTVEWERLFDAPIDERVADYLASRFDEVASEAVLPDWHLTTDIDPARPSLEYLPWVAKDLSLVRLPDREPPSDQPSEPEPVTDFLRHPRDGDDAPGDGALHRPHDQPSPADGTVSLLRLPDAQTPEHRWVGEAIPLETQVPHRAAIQRHLSRYPPEQDDHVISIDFVCNDEAMSDENIVQEVYGVRELLDYDVRSHYSLTRGELREVLHSSSDLLHYVGHVDEEGIRCVDGALDARTLDTVNVDAFLLNACRSYEQGQALLEAGSLAGVVTLSSVSNTVATRMGHQLARLLNTGLRFRSALAILQQYVPLAHQYIVFGAGNLQLVQSASGTPNMVAIEGRDGDQFTVTQSYYPASGYDIGSLLSPIVDESDKHYLNTGTVGPYTMGEGDLISMLEREEVPVEVMGELTWSSDVAMWLRRESEPSLADIVAGNRGSAVGLSDGVFE